jgi:hypothetical protein
LNTEYMEPFQTTMQPAPERQQQESCDEDSVRTPQQQAPSTPSTLMPSVREDVILTAMKAMEMRLEKRLDRLDTKLNALHQMVLKIKDKSMAESSNAGIAPHL